MYNILTESLIRVVKSNGAREKASLPAVYAALMTDQVEAFPALRPHQRHAWHAFLVQLGAMAVHRADLNQPPEQADEWLRIIKALTRDELAKVAYPDDDPRRLDEPWQLVVDDITKPAFMQPPARSEERSSDYKSAVATPDELDMLVTSKNHDLKSAVAVQSATDDWMFALITLQTMEGFSGAGNYGISRMNGGMSSRPAFSITQDIRLGAHAKRDMKVLLERRQEPNGHCLLWALPWDGAPAEALLLSALDPHYLEICRRIRLGVDGSGDLSVVRTSSKAARIEAKASKGITGDPWTPIDRKDAKSLTLANGGFTYKRTVEYLFGDDWEMPELLRPTDAEVRSPETMTLVARGMVRGQGKTEGYYERMIPVRKRFQSAMLRQSGQDDIGQIATVRIEYISAVQRILSHAIQVFLAGGDSDAVGPEHRNLARPWLNRLDGIVDRTFFDDLQDEFEEEDSEERDRMRNRWLMNRRDGVVDHARNILSAAIDSLPCPAIHRFKARANAEALFEGRIRGNRGLPFLFTEKGDDDES
ncbi:MAG: type I-E CRISPR-associated protein Cse1/CasA [Chloroflexi bacterium]|nr:type I-E CRISPR-associated protein Cse1/CasA [Chloroflexota bacterium]